MRHTPIGRLVALLAAAACHPEAGFRPEAGIPPEGALGTASLDITVEADPGTGPFEHFGPISMSKQVTATVQGRELRMTPSRKRPPRLDGDLSTTYAVEDSVLDNNLPSLMYYSAGYAPPDSSGWQDLTYTSDSGNVMTYQESLGSIGQPLNTSTIVDNLTEFKEIYTWTTTGSGVTLNTARYELSEPTTGALIKLQVLVDSLKVTVLSQNQPGSAVWRQEVALATLDPTPLLAQLMMINPRFAGMPRILMGDCSGAKADLWIARILLVGSELAFLEAPTPATFFLFAGAFAYTGRMRKLMLIACRT